MNVRLGRHLAGPASRHARLPPSASSRLRAILTALTKTSLLEGDVDYVHGMLGLMRLLPTGSLISAYSIDYEHDAGA
jgi:hypothetical protein